MKNTEITLLFGAGISKPLGMPLVQDIYNLLFEENYRYFVEDKIEKFERLPKAKRPTTNSDSDDVMKEVQNFLQGIFYYDEHYLRTIAPLKYKNGIKYCGSAYRKKSNYEVLYHLSEQILLTNQGLTDNPMIATFMEKIANQKFDDFFGIEKILEIEQKSQLALKFIQWVVTEELNKKIDLKLIEDNFKFITDIIESNDFDKVNIITLNHDTLIEQLLLSKNIDFCDGFEKSNSDINYYIGFEYNTSKVNIIKPHGSINWFSTSIKRETINVKLSEHIQKNYFDITEYMDLHNTPIKFIKNHPDYLSGMGKIEKYNYGIYSDMTFEMHKILKSNNQIIMCGYGWGDSAINGRLGRYLDSTNKIILLHPNPEELKDNSVYLDGQYEYLEMSEKIISVKSWMCNTNYNEIKQHLTK